MSLITKYQLNLVIQTFKKLLSFKVDKSELKSVIETELKSVIEYVDDCENRVKNAVILIDEANGYEYILRMRGGRIITYCKNMTDIQIVKLPTKTLYLKGEKFDPAGLGVYRVNEDGTLKPITGYEIKESVSTGETEFTVSYTNPEDKKVYTTTGTLEKVSEIKIIGLPTKTHYIEGETFDPTGLKVIVVGDKGSNVEIADYTVTEPEITRAGNIEFTVSYTHIDGTVYSVTKSIPITCTTQTELSLIDFKYKDNGDGTFTIIDWKDTLNGEPSTECIIPDDPNIIL